MAARPAMSALDLATMAADRTLFIAWAAGRGWSVGPANTGYLRCERQGSVILGPRLGKASCDGLRELAMRLVHVECYRPAARREVAVRLMTAMYRMPCVACGAPFGPVVIHGVRIIQQVGGVPWLALPQTPARRKRDGSGSGWSGIVEVIDPAVSDRLRTKALRAWESAP